MFFFAARRLILAALLVLTLLTYLLRPALAEELVARPGDVVLGQADAPITMVEYYSLNCSHCAAFHLNIFPQLKTHYIDSGKIRFVFRDFPLSWAALEAAILIHCAAPEDFLGVQDALLASINQWSGSDSALLAIAKIGEANGVERAAYKQCVEDGVLQSQILENYKFFSETLGIEGTPTFFINGEKYVGGISLERLVKILVN